MWRILATAASLQLLAPLAARADDYEAAAAKAVPVEGASLAALFWSQLDSCNRGSDFDRRQCEGVRQARRAQVAATTYRVEVQGAVRLGDFNPKTKSADAVLEACVACDGIDFDGERRLITGKGKHDVAGGAVRAQALGDHAVVFATPDEAAAWKDKVLPRLRTEMLIKLPAQLQPWADGGSKGYAVEVVGFRTYDPCDGKVLVSRPKSDGGEVDQTTCGKEPEKPVEVKKEPERPKLPERVTTEEIDRALEPVKLAAQKCFETYGVPGQANLKITFNGDGAITKALQQGDFLETPTGACIDKAVREVKFPASQKKTTTVTYPLVLQ